MTEPESQWKEQEGVKRNTEVNKRGMTGNANKMKGN